MTFSVVCTYKPHRISPVAGNRQREGRKDQGMTLGNGTPPDTYRMDDGKSIREAEELRNPIWNRAG